MTETVVNQKILNGVDGLAAAGAFLSGICFLCQAPLKRPSAICDACSRDLPLNQPACPACAIPVIQAGHCAACLQANSPLIQRALCVYRYEFPLSTLIQQMKFHAHMGVAEFLGEKIADQLLVSGAPLPQAIIPVPLHPRRLAYRGYNQAAVLAAKISQRTGVPADFQMCRRLRHTVPQTELPADERRKNIRGVFKISGTTVAGYRHIAIVDDVVTTGSTVAEIARLFLRAGTGRVDAWACARAAI